MIDSLNGELLERGQDHVVLDCHGVGYLVQVSANTLGRLPAKGVVRMHVHYAVTVDVRSGSSEHRLYGFLNADERQLFRRLIDVQGVSATIGMSILSARSAEDVHTAVLTGNVQVLQSVKGIGPKLAQRIVTELQGKLAGSATPIGASGPVGGNTVKAEALSALVSLGLDRMKAERALHAVLQEHGDAPPTLETVIKLALKNL
ncbi:MAG: Holliday junction branch migration protein RuvA [Flavobacteriales bacterium]|jgi:Holliday junction DNA helicase RuvA|nr:Holliday junction branch migration protein RuvA [Flavobacteriales bacterium]MBK9514486.1 Holliday junction branch migration protein RuvA [Flavobacteriales bacterium]